MIENAMIGNAMIENTMILEVSGVNKTYAKSDFALKDISFSLPPGAIMGVIGENGSGKTTTLSIILGLRKADSGTVKVFGSSFDREDVDIKEKIGVVFDGNYFPNDFTIKDISYVFGKIYKRWDAAYFFDNVEAYGIDPKLTIKKMSHGTKATLAIITALSQRPELLILDEPTGGVDPVRREDVLDLFMDFTSDGKKSILFSSHITSDLEKIADYVTFIHKGQILESAAKDTFLYGYGIIRCNQESFDTLLATQKDNIARYIKRDYQYRVLMKDQQTVTGDFLMENPTLDEILYLFSKGILLTGSNGMAPPSGDLT